MTNLNSGSRWNRWEPHVHAPGTVLNDLFAGADPWPEYLTALESADPPIKAIGVTDYYVTNTYERVLQEKAGGRLPNVDLIFPNVEVRLGVGTARRWVNLHLLVSPEDPEHLVQLRRFMSRLNFRAYSDVFSCNRDDLIRLGKAADKTLTDEVSALRHGASQFKVSFEQLREEFAKFEWAGKNILIAVAGNQADGTSGVRAAADTTLRQEVEKFAHVIFASSDSQRDFWLGRKSLSVKQLREQYGGLKPCLHGSDAHELPKVGVPDGGRFSWIKGSVQFDSIRQACIDPAGRAYVGRRPPLRAVTSRVISTIELVGANWATTPKLALNPGLVAIVGARGSGKTALVDAIAAGCDAISEHRSAASFIERARDHLEGVTVKLEWETGPGTERPLLSNSQTDLRYPNARYLSQKFVEELCSADNLTDELLKEIERVIFESHTVANREGTTNFEELLVLKTGSLRERRLYDEEAIASLSDRIGQEIEKRTKVPAIKAEIGHKRQQIANYTASRDKLVPSGASERVARLVLLTKGADYVRTQIRLWMQEEQSLKSLQQDVESFRLHRAPEELRASKQKFVGTNLKPEEWENFRQKYSGDVDAVLAQKLANAQQNIAGWRGTTPPAKANDNEPYLPEEIDQSRLSLGIVEAEIARMQRLINVDADTANRFKAVSDKIADENAQLTRLEASLTDCEGANDRVQELQHERGETYLDIFETIIEEERALHELYGPLMKRLEGKAGTLSKLTFSVSRHANIDAWAADGESLLDLRKQGPFKGVGTLRAWAEAALKPAWERGAANDVATAMEQFRERHQESLLDLSAVPKAQQADYRAWLRRFAIWLFGTEHVTLQYSIDYEGVDIRKLSPGTRGIVLLLLYLALDDADDRPLIIDQPEENLDPKSIFDELVELFVEAKDKRQVIMVTHNANLVVNTDADQIIVASAGTHSPGELPPITYVSGGLESEEMRLKICGILEGGVDAFIERARRLRVNLAR